MDFRMKELKNFLQKYRVLVDDYLKNYFKSDNKIPDSLKKGMEYSVFAGGKRIRPILCLIFAELFGESKKNILPFACGLELIHTYSLIHDDLPAMDNDDFRRGKPTNHKVFGEAMAILSGDGLLTEGFYLMLKCNVEVQRLHRAILEVCDAVGPRGIVGGQVIDMELTGSGLVEINLLKKMHKLKTGAFIRAACTSGAYLAGAREEDVEKVSRFGEYLGLAFQIADDILDVIGDEKKIGKPVGSDEQKGKITYPAVLGLKQSYELGWEAVDKALSYLRELPCDNVHYLELLAKYIMERSE